MEFKKENDKIVLHVNLCKGCKEMLAEYNPYIYPDGTAVPHENIRVHIVSVDECENTLITKCSDKQSSFIFTVRRVRGSVTQGVAKVYLNGEEVAEFDDKIELLKDDEKFYGENIGGWASRTPDADFVKGVLFHPYDDFYKYSEKVREILNRDQ